MISYLQMDSSALPHFFIFVFFVFFFHLFDFRLYNRCVNNHMLNWSWGFYHVSQMSLRYQISKLKKKTERDLRGTSISVCMNVTLGAKHNVQRIPLFNLLLIPRFWWTCQTKGRGGFTFVIFWGNSGWWESHFWLLGVQTIFQVFSKPQEERFLDSEETKY